MLEPNGGNFYKPHVLMINSGLFWRCKHGKSHVGYRFCFKCASRSPVSFLRWYGLIKTL